MSRLGHAFSIASEIHENQLDKADAPYMLHCVAVMQAVTPDKDVMAIIKSEPKGLFIDDKS